MKTILLTILVMTIAGCGTMSKMELQADGTFKEVPIMTCKTFARDLSYSRIKTTTKKDGTIVIESETYTTKGTTAGIIGAGAGLLGAASSLSPL